MSLDFDHTSSNYKFKFYEKRRVNLDEVHNNDNGVFWRVNNNDHMPTKYFYIFFEHLFSYISTITLHIKTCFVLFF